MSRLTAAAAAFLVLTAAASARPAPQRPVPAALLAALDDRATACFADTILSNAGAMRAARAGRWYEAAGVTGYLCRPEVGEMMRAHDDVARRPGAGLAYFRKVYVRHLEAALSARVGEAVARKSVAEALPPPDPEPAGGSEAGTGPTP